MADLMNYTTHHGWGYADNYKTLTNNQADVGRELIVRFVKSSMTYDDIWTFMNKMTMAQGKSATQTASATNIFTPVTGYPNGHPYADAADPLPVDTVTIAALGTPDGLPIKDKIEAAGGSTLGEMWFRCQTTGEPNIDDAAAEAGGSATIVAYFAPLH